MYEYISSFHAMVGTHPVSTYAFFFLLSVAKNIVPPIPGDTALVYGGYLVGRGVLSVLPMLVVTFAGHLTGFMTVYWIARRYGRAGLNLLPLLRFADSWIDRAERHMQRFGFVIIILNRFMPGVRTVIPLTVGLVKIPARIVVVCAALSIAIWNTLLIYTGAAVGRSLDQVADVPSSHNTFIMVLLIAAAIGSVAWFLARKYVFGRNA